jgi:hypothetical protein
MTQFARKVATHQKARIGELLLTMQPHSLTVTRRFQTDWANHVRAFEKSFSLLDDTVGCVIHLRSWALF